MEYLRERQCDVMQQTWGVLYLASYSSNMRTPHQLCARLNKTDVAKGDVQQSIVLQSAHALNSSK